MFMPFPAEAVIPGLMLAGIIGAGIVVALYVGRG